VNFSPRRGRESDETEKVVTTKQQKGKRHEYRTGNGQESVTDGSSQYTKGWQFYIRAV
jgi:hypothetical protein